MRFIKKLASNNQIIKDYQQPIINKQLLIFKQPILESKLSDDRRIAYFFVCLTDNLFCIRIKTEPKEV